MTMTRPGDQDHDHEPLPEQPFPGESEWLTVPLPAPGPTGGLADRDFVDRVVQAIVDERGLDRELAAADRELPRIVLQAYDVPPATGSFVERTLAAARDDRRARWQQLLARHVAPEPSPQFVQRTLAALRREPAPGARARRLGDGGTRWFWPLLAAAGLALLFWLRGDHGGTPGERFGGAAISAHAEAWAFGPGAVVLANCADDREPAALPGSAPDGIWLAFAEVR